MEFVDGRDLATLIAEEAPLVAGAYGAPRDGDRQRPLGCAPV
jgi:hypothetical protein